MSALSRTGYQVVKAFHLFFVSVWLGSWLCLLLLLLVPVGNAGLPPILKAESQIHLTIVIPSVIGSLITGIIFSGATKWGFFKHRWIIIKYVANIFPIVGGALIFVPSLRGMTNIANSSPGVLANPAYIADRNAAVLFLLIQFVFVCGAIYLSVFKPHIGPKRSQIEVHRHSAGEIARNI